MNAERKQWTFISYSRKDKDFALELARELKSAGHFVWLDQLDIPTGARWDDEVERALRECHTFLVILTSASTASENVKDEIGYAIDHKKRIVPVFLEECDVPLRLRRFQYVDFTRVKFGEGIKRVKQLLEDSLNNQPIPVPPSTLPEVKERPKAKVATVSSLQAPTKSVAHRPQFSVAGIIAFVALIGVLGIVLIFKDSISSIFSPKSRITLEPNYSLVSSVELADLEKAAQILTARATVLDNGMTFVVAENNQIIGQASQRTLSQDLIQQTIATGLLEIVDFGETPVQPGTTIATDFVFRSFPEVEGTKWHTVITNAEFESASLEQRNSGEYYVSFTLIPSGTNFFSKFTTENVGNYVGIVLDKVVVSAPILNTPIIDGIGEIAGNLTKEEAESIVSYLQIKSPLPIPLVVKQISENGN